MDPTRTQHILEACLLVAGRPMNVAQLEALFEGDDERPTRDGIRDAIAALQAQYAERAIEIVEVASGWRLQSRIEVQHWVTRLFQERTPRYSRALLETLVLVAYRQPITRGEIEEVRGVAVSSNIVRTLQERQWVREVGYKDVPGRPALLGTTRQFLDYFNLKRLEDLPTLGELKDLDAFDAVLAETGLVDGATDARAANDSGDAGGGESAPAGGPDEGPGGEGGEGGEPGPDDDADRPDPSDEPGAEPSGGATADGGHGKAADDADATDVTDDDVVDATTVDVVLDEEDTADDRPGSGMSGTSGTDAPETDALESDAPETDAPETDASDIDAPGPEASASDVPVPTALRTIDLPLADDSVPFDPERYRDEPVAPAGPAASDVPAPAPHGPTRPASVLSGQPREVGPRPLPDPEPADRSGPVGEPAEREAVDAGTGPDPVGRGGAETGERESGEAVAVAVEPPAETGDGPDGSDDPEPRPYEDPRSALLRVIDRFGADQRRDIEGTALEARRAVRAEEEARGDAARSGIPAEPPDRDDRVP